MSSMALVWDLTPLFQSDDDPKMAVEETRVRREAKRFRQKWRLRSDYLSEVGVLAEALNEYSEWECQTGTDGDLGYYFSLRTAQNQADPKLLGREQQIIRLGQEMETEIQFFVLGLAKIKPAQQEIFLAAEELAAYHVFLRRLFAQAEHLLSEAEENILLRKAEPACRQWVEMTSRFLAAEEREVLSEDGSRAKQTEAELMTLMTSRQKIVRDEAALAFNDILAKQSNVAEAELNAILQNKQIDDELRQFDRPDAERHLADDMESEVVDAMLSAVQAQFGVAERYYQLKARLLGVPRLAYHERNVEIGMIGAGHYPISKAIQLVCRVFGELDPEFAEIVLRFQRHNQFDVPPRLHKRGGAFCAHHLLSQPTYILLNHTGRFHDVLTLAHELGHGINNELMRGQPPLYFGTSLATAEVASTFMEDFVLRDLKKQLGPAEQLAVNMQKLNDDISTVFRQVACYRFEQRLHERYRQTGYLSKVEIGQIFQTEMAAYMGSAVLQSTGSENWWVYWGHIRTFFYVYSYASGLLISKALQRAVREQPTFIGQVKQFLAAGRSASPRELFQELGLDIGAPTFWQRGLQEICDLLGETERLADQK